MDYCSLLHWCGILSYLLTVISHRKLKIVNKIALSGGLIAIIAILAIIAVYLFFDPASSAWMPQCIFHRLTGLQCPGCGMQRMLHALLTGDFQAAWHYNAFLLCALPFLFFMIWLELARKRVPRLYARFYSLPMILIISGLLVGWFIFRNL